jgi:hypothetical protein
MGREVHCEGQVGAMPFVGKAMLEDGMIHLRGSRRLDVSLSDLGRVLADGDTLALQARDGTELRLALGAKETALWARKIASPPSRLDKLGIKAATQVAVLGLEDKDFDHELIRAGLAPAPLADADCVLLAMHSAQDLERIGQTASVMTSKAHLWVLRPRKAVAGLGEAEVMAAGRALGLQLSKTLKFSEAFTGERFTWPRPAIGVG